MKNREQLFELAQEIANYTSDITEYGFVENNEFMANALGYEELTEEQLINYDKSCDFVLLNDKQEVISFSKKEAIEYLKTKEDKLLELAKEYNINIEDFE